MFCIKHDCLEPAFCMNKYCFHYTGVEVNLCMPKLKTFMKTYNFKCKDNLFITVH